MKKVLKFLIFALGLEVAQGAYAVKLPANSYIPAPEEYMIYSTDETGTTRVAGTTFAMLGTAAGPIEQYCTSTYSTYATKAQCTQCCSEYEEAYIEADPENEETYKEDAKSCRATCKSYSLPLDGGAWLLLLLSAAAVAVKSTKLKFELA